MQGNGYTTGEIRGTFSDHHFVICVYYAVVVLIFIFDISRLNSTE